ncbi:anti-sigma factor [Nocardioides glacieisoli]|uniref:Anti-sigma factor n=1 Tax=Nocardioides glacieisoli TaxID=1168730 RepID=A0A4Q2RMJ5_9ACTN|nr:anti-sigma factor [Nocardioides glacieisoli]RYB88839.1 anti-sigma factor [Nocardioides glacieisoli]
MSHAELDDLAGLALDRDDVSPDVQRHVDGCLQCTEAVDAFAAARALAGGGPLVAPPQHVRAQVMTHVRRGTPDARSAAIPLPVALESHPRARRGISPWLAGIAAALALLAGLGLGRLTGEPAPTPEAVDPGTVVAAADLTALDSDAARGVASAVETADAVTLRVSAEELGDGDGVHEVWLINVDGKRMVAIGLLASGDEGQFEVPLGLIDKGYRIVDISVEPDDGDPTHSGVSLARGELA